MYILWEIPREVIVTNLENMMHMELRDCHIFCSDSYGGVTFKWWTVFLHNQNIQIVFEYRLSCRRPGYEKQLDDHIRARLYRM